MSKPKSYPENTAPPGTFVDIRFAKSERAALDMAIVKQLEGASLDELRVIAFVVERLCMLGRANYGPLDLATDERDFGSELSEELVDAIVYVACEVIRRVRR